MSHKHETRKQRAARKAANHRPHEVMLPPLSKRAKYLRARTRPYYNADTDEIRRKVDAEHRSKYTPHQGEREKARRRSA